MSILISIKPRWCELIASGKKTIELRKTKPKCKAPFKVYIYCTNSPPYLVYGDRFDGNGFVDGYYTVKGYSREQADKLWGVLNGKVIGEFICDKILRGEYENINGYCGVNAEWGISDCLTASQLADYSDGKTVYGWHISDLKIYNEPKELAEFGLKRAPQSWCRVEEL